MTTDWRGLTVFTRTGTSRSEEALGALTAFMRTVDEDRLLLLTILSQGESRFVNVLREETKGLAVDDGMIRLVWQWLVARAGPHPEQEREWLEIDRRDHAWKAQRQVDELAKIETAAQHNLRLKGDALFDGEKVTTAEKDDPRL